MTEKWERNFEEEGTFSFEKGENLEEYFKAVDNLPFLQVILLYLP